jgi:hypothetical protein
MLDGLNESEEDLASHVRAQEVPWSLASQPVVRRVQPRVRIENHFGDLGEDKILVVTEGSNAGSLYH